MFDLGVWIRETYNYTNFFHVYLPWKVHLESSGFDRTLVSADSLALGAFDYAARDPHGESYLQQMPANIPVYSTENQHDVYLRAHDKCEAFHNRLDELYESKIWKDLEEEHMDLLRHLAQLETFQEQADESGKIPLTTLWNVYDAIHVAKTECVVSGDGYAPTCLSLDNPSDADALEEGEFEELEVLVSRVEQLRYGPERAGRLVGGPLLLKILERMSRSLAGDFFLYSAHYSTILGVLSALGESFENKGAIPEYASALMLFLLEDTTTGKQRVQLVFKADSQFVTPPKVVPLQFCALEQTCPLITFRERFFAWSVHDWCKECNNRQAAVCMSYWIEEYEGENFGLDQPLTVGFSLGFGLAAFMACMFWFCCSSTRVKFEVKEDNNVQQTAPPESPQPPELPGDDAAEETTAAAGAGYEENGQNTKDPVMT